MELENLSPTPQKLETISPCCCQTIQKHVQYNPMMVCDTCRKLIKCFKQEDTFRNYVKFCMTRGRDINVAQYLGYLVVIFNGYKP